MKLSNLNSKELDEKLQNEMNDLMRKFAEGEISSYQARIFFYDQIRDAIPIKKEIFLREGYGSWNFRNDTERSQKS